MTNKSFSAYAMSFLILISQVAAFAPALAQEGVQSFNWPSDGTKKEGNTSTTPPPAKAPSAVDTNASSDEAWPWMKKDAAPAAKIESQTKSETKGDGKSEFFNTSPKFKSEQAEEATTEKSQKAGSNEKPATLEKTGSVEKSAPAAASAAAATSRPASSGTIKLFGRIRRNHRIARCKISDCLESNDAETRHAQRNRLGIECELTQYQPLLRQSGIEFSARLSVVSGAVR